MDRPDGDLSIDISQGDRHGDPQEEQSPKQFSKCSCKEPIIEPISYMLPDDTFINILHCQACKGIEQYSITDLSNPDSDNSTEEPSRKRLIQDLGKIEKENERLRRKIKQQSRRMRFSQENHFQNSEQAVVAPSPVVEEDEAGEDQTDSQETGGTHISSATRKLLLASLVIGVAITGSVIWTTRILSSIAIIAGTLLIIVPVFFLTDGEISHDTEDKQ